MHNYSEGIGSKGTGLRGHKVGNEQPVWLHCCQSSAVRMLGRHVYKPEPEGL